MNEPNFSVVILAAGQGTRMRSDRHKVLHPIADKPMLLHLLDTVEGMGAARQVVVVGKGREQIEAALAGRGVTIAVQAEQKGTAHAVAQARDALAGARGPVLILYGDTPFVTAATLRRMLDRLGRARCARGGRAGQLARRRQDLWPGHPGASAATASPRWSNIRTPARPSARCACAIRG